MPTYRYTEKMPQHRYPVRNPNTFSITELHAMERAYFAWLKREHPSIYKSQRTTPEEQRDREFRAKYQQIIGLRKP